MKHLLLLLFLITYANHIKTEKQLNGLNVTTISQTVAYNWFHSHIKKISHKQIIEILHVILLTHYLIQYSLDMTHHKLNLQEETLQLYSPSITDSLHASIKMKQNNFKEIYRSLEILEKNQQKLQSVYQHIQKTGAWLVTQQPEMAQEFINNIKTILIAWSSHQNETVDSFIQATESLKKIKESVKKISNHYHKMITAEDLPHHAIQLFASSLSQNYHELEQTFLTWITLNKNRAIALKSVFTEAFKEHFKLLYHKLTKQEQICFKNHIKQLYKSTLPHNTLL